MKKTILLFIGGVSIFTLGCNLSKVEEYKEQPEPMSRMEIYERTGGQPGDISLNGDFLDSDNNLKPSVSVVQKAGTNVDGGSPEVLKDHFKVSKMDQNSADELEDLLTYRKKVLVFRCPISIAAKYIPKLSEVENKQDTIMHDEELLKLDDRNMYIDAWADTILICGSSMIFPTSDSLRPTSIYLYARKVILYDADLKFDPIQHKHFQIKTPNLILIGDSHIGNKPMTVNYHGLEDHNAKFAYELFHIRITAHKITGDGHLEVSTTGISKK